MVRTNLLVMVAVCATILAAQVTPEPRANTVPYGEAEFRKAVQDGLPVDPLDRAVRYVIGNEEIAIPILMAEIRTKLNDPRDSLFVFFAADLATHRPNQRSIDAAAELYRMDPKRFSYLVEHVLNNGVSFQREFEFAYYTVEHHPNLQEPVMKWLKHTLQLSMMDERFAKELLKREKAGHPYWVDDPLLSRLPDETRKHIEQVVSRVRFEPR
jgi:hypothetical protein